MEKLEALIYCRVSSERQKNEGHGLDAQEHRCREFARQKGHREGVIFRDSFTGGGDFMQRPAMVELLNYIDKHAHKKYVVIFDDLSRLARDVTAHINLRMAFKSRGVSVECPNFNFSDTDESELVEMVLAAQNQYHRKSNRRQVIQKQRARIEKGYCAFNPPPGLKHIKDQVHGKLLVPDEPRASIIKSAFEGFASGRFQEQVDVQKFLQEKDFCDGGKVYLEAVRRIFNRVVYAGYIEYKPWEITRRKGHHKPLISLETYEKVQERLYGKIKVFTRKDTNEDFPVRGLILCAKCQRPFTGSLTKGRNAYFPYYRCDNGGCGEHNKSIRKKDLEDALESILEKVEPKKEICALTKAIILDAWNKRSERADEIRIEHNKNLLEVSKEISGLLKRIPKTKNEKVIRAYESRIEELSGQEQLLQEKTGVSAYTDENFETALNGVLDFIKKPVITWRNGGLDDKRRVLKLVFAEKLVYDRENGFETAKLSIPLRVFELSATSKSQGVETAGVEPASESFTN